MRTKKNNKPRLIPKNNHNKQKPKVYISKNNKITHKKHISNNAKQPPKLYISKNLSELIDTIIVEKIHTDDYMANKEGHWFGNKDYIKTITKNTDCVYLDNKMEYKVLFRFRKNVIDKKLTELATKCWKKYAMKLHNNRGAAAGLLDRTKMAKYIGKLVNPNSFRSKYIGTYTNELHKQLISNDAPSNIIGYFDKIDRNIGKSRIPCRLTAFTRKHKELWEESTPFIKRINYLFKELMPKEYKNQHSRAHKTKFVIDDTAYSTLTINHNWRTALHRDKGDYVDGFGNLSVAEEGDYSGGCLGFPQFGIQLNGGKKKGSINIDVRNGDFLAMDVHQWHCNSEIVGKTNDYSRLSIVAYLRENMLRCQNL